ncbi:MAG: hypothetical protein AB7G75_22700 [Candidatus Binatia bacterium]
MAHTTTTERLPSNLRGVGTLFAEAAHLLWQVRFSANRGAVAKGERVTVIVDPRWSTDNTTIQVLIACHALWTHQEEWQRLVLIAQRTDAAAAVSHIASFNQAGAALFSSLPPGCYSLSAYERGRKLMALKRREASIHVNDEMVAAGEKVSAGPVTNKSLDGHITTTVSPTASGIEVAFETAEETLAGAQVQFALASRKENEDELTGQATLLTGAVTLQSVPGQPRLWEGFWQGDVPASGSYELLFMRVQGNEI